MKVAYFGSTSQVHSGASQWMFRMADSMREYGHETLAMLPEDSGIARQYEDSDVETLIMWSEPLRWRRSPLGQVVFLLRSFLAALHLGYLLRRNNIDVFHVNEIRYPYALVGGWLGGATVVCHVRVNLDSPFVAKTLARFTLLFTTEIYCVSRKTEEVMFGRFDIDDDRIVVIYDGLPSPERLDELPQHLSFRSDINVDEDETLVLSVSKLVHNKGQDRLIRAADAIDADVQIAIVGGSVSGHEGYAEQLESLAANRSNVQLVGFYENAIAAIASCDVFVHLPRHNDPFPGVVLEAQMAGKPVVGSRSGGIPEQIQDNGTGVLVPKEDAIEEIATTIDALATDELRRKQMGKAASTSAFDRFDPQEYFETLEQHYRALP
ncbi:glycosyltransferase family 4 protein [Natrinema salinisoli]|uniref:glycosyltransferase family 4 protein n=1 Tax=Natrinema salinisoli TaxID=2878535 RepID=UPI001CEFF617|nr:glycosyltransferase family 4 protein [Natrinema salinisoli]